MAGVHKHMIALDREWDPVLPHTPCAATMLVSPDDPMSIFVNGKLKPGTYKIQNLTGQTYLEILEDSRKWCCRPGSVLSAQDALVSFKIYWAER